MRDRMKFVPMKGMQIPLTYLVIDNYVLYSASRPETSVYTPVVVPSTLKWELFDLVETERFEEAYAKFMAARLSGEIT